MLIWDYCRVELVTRRPTWKELKQFPKKTLAELSGSNCTLWFSTLSHGTQILAVADTTTLLDTLAAGGWECVAAHVDHECNTPTSTNGFAETPKSESHDAHTTEEGNQTDGEDSIQTRLLRG